MSIIKQAPSMVDIGWAPSEAELQRRREKRAMDTINDYMAMLASSALGIDIKASKPMQPLTTPAEPATKQSDKCPECGGRGYYDDHRDGQLCNLCDEGDDLPPEFCVECGHPEESHGYGRTVGCQHGDGTAENPICFCRKMRGELSHKRGDPYEYHGVRSAESDEFIKASAPMAISIQPTPPTAEPEVTTAGE